MQLNKLTTKNNNMKENIKLTILAIVGFVVLTLIGIDASGDGGALQRGVIYPKNNDKVAVQGTKYTDEGAYSKVQFTDTLTITKGHYFLKKEGNIINWNDSDIKFIDGASYEDKSLSPEGTRWVGKVINGITVDEEYISGEQGKLNKGLGNEPIPAKFITSGEVEVYKLNNTGFSIVRLSPLGKVLILYFIVFGWVFTALSLLLKHKEWLNNLVFIPHGNGTIIMVTTTLFLIGGFYTLITGFILNSIIGGFKYPNL